MPRLPESPRARRRLLWVCVVCALVAAGVSVAVLIPSKGSVNGAPTINEGPAQLASTRKARLTRADRRAIDAALDSFIPDAMERKNLVRAWKLAGPEFRAGSTLDEWRKGSTPVPFYPAADTSFHGWDVIDLEPGSVIFNIVLHPRAGAKEPTTVFSGQVVKEEGEWHVNRMYAISLEYKLTKTTHEVGPADFGAGAVYHPPPPDKARWGGIGIIPIVAILALVLLIPAALGTVALVRARRWRRHARGGARSTLPPLPAAYRRTAADDKEIVSRP